MFKVFCFCLQDNSKPLVPEISILVDDSAQTETIVPRQPTSYKEWKQNQNKNQQMYRNGNASANAFSANGTGGEKKKNVKFNLSPDDLNTNSEQQFKLPIDQAIDENLAAQCNQLDLSLCEPTIVDNAKGNQNCGANRQQFSDNRLTGDSMQNNLRQQNVKHFRDSSKQLSNPQCMHQTANAVTWNRNVNNEQQEINLDDVYRLLQNIQQKNVATPQLYEPPMPTQNHLRNAQQNLVLHDNQQPIVPSNEVNVGQMSNSEPTIKDLFSVIVKQQEQLLNIQKQVHMLLMNPRSVGAAHNHFQGGPDFNQLNGRPKPMGVMTSFEINVQPCKPRMSLQPNEIHKSQNVCNDIEAKTSSEPKKCSCNCSCGVLETVKQTSKPVQSSDSESNDENSDSFQNGWAFYGNILNQVNNVLQNSPQITKPNQHPIETIATNHQNLFERTDEYHVQQNQFTPNITKTVRSAQIKQVGFQFDDVNISATSKR